MEKLTLVQIYHDYWYTFVFYQNFWVYKFSPSPGVKTYIGTSKPKYFYHDPGTIYIGSNSSWLLLWYWFLLQFLGIYNPTQVPCSFDGSNILYFPWSKFIFKSQKLSLFRVFKKRGNTVKDGRNWVYLNVMLKT